MVIFDQDALLTKHQRAMDSITRSSKSGRNTANKTVAFPAEKLLEETEQRDFANSRPASEDGKKMWQRVNRHEQNVDPWVTHIYDHPPPTANGHIRNLMPKRSLRNTMKRTPFQVFHDAFAETIGESPKLELLTTDSRAPYFYSGGTFLPRLSTLYLTSNLIRDSDPGAASSANRKTEITKIEFFSSRSFSRDKIRGLDQSCMAAGVALYPNGESSGIVICAQGSLKDPAGIVYVDTRRPHKAHMLLNNFQGRPFNSPCDIVANPLDGSLYFTDPHYGYERGFRPKPKLPGGHIYRFDPESGDCRVVANGHERPGGLALSPDYGTLYVSELSDKFGGTTIYAYSIVNTDAYKGSQQPSFQISVSSSNSASNKSGFHKSTPSNSSVGSSGPPPPDTATTDYSRSYSLNRTAPLSPTTKALGSIRSDYRPYTHSHSRNASDQNSIHAPQSSGFRPHSSNAFLINKRLFTYTPSISQSAQISCDPRIGHLFLGTLDGIEVFACDSGSLIGKILIDDSEGLPVPSSEEEKRKRRYMKGASKVAFGLGGDFWMLGGERIWKGCMDWGGVEGLGL